jgi:hypothetical protein
MGMALIVVSALAALVGSLLIRWWLLLLPVALASIAFVLGLISGTLSHQDNPVVFLMAVAELGLAAGMILRRHLAPVR